MADKPKPNEVQAATGIYNQVAAGYEDMNKKSQSGYGYNVRSDVPGPGFSGSYSTPRGNLITIGTPPPGPHDRGRSVQSPGGGGGGGSRITRPGGGGGGGGSAGYSVGYQGPTMKKPTFNRPGDLDLPDYAPPGYDEGVEKKLHQQYMAPGMSQIRRSTQQAMISSKSLDNPNARALFVNKALEGVGAAVSQVSGSAGKQATSEARARYSDEVSMYNTKWGVQADEIKSKWDKDWDMALMEYKTQMGLYSQMPMEQQVEESTRVDPRDYNKQYAQRR